MIYRVFTFAVIVSVSFLLSCKSKSSTEYDKPVVRRDVHVWWHTAEFDSVFAYLYNGRFLGDSIVLHGRLHSTIAAKSKRRLSKNQIDEIRGLLDGITDTSGDTIPMADCFHPSQGFVFYSKGAISAHISVCYQCGYNICFPEGYSVSNERLTHIFDEVGLPILDEQMMYYHYDSIMNRWYK